MLKSKRKVLGSFKIPFLGLLQQVSHCYCVLIVVLSLFYCPDSALHTLFFILIVVLRVKKQLTLMLDC